jgi:hypothetical protein
MAFKEQADWTSLNGGEIFRNGTFNIDMAVGNSEVGTGKMAANRLTDMQSMQEMIGKIIYWMTHYCQMMQNEKSKQECLFFNNLKMRKNEITTGSQTLTAMNALLIEIE